MDSEERPKGRSLRPLATLWPFIRPHTGSLAAAMAALLVAAAAMLALPVALRFLIDRGFADGDVGTINRYFAWFLAAAVVFGGFAALRFYLVTWLGERVVADVRTAVYDRVIRMDPLFFEVTRVGEVLSRLTTDTTLVQSISGVSLSIVLRTTLTLIGAMIMLLLTSYKLTGYILLLIPVVIVPLIAVGRRIRRLSRTAQDRIADTSGLAGETLNAIQTVQAFTLEGLQSERYAGAVDAGFDAAVRRTRVRAVITALGVTLVFGAITLVLWVGSRAVVAGEMTGGEAFHEQALQPLHEAWPDLERRDWIVIAGTDGDGGDVLLRASAGTGSASSDGFDAAANAVSNEAGTGGTTAGTDGVTTID